MNNIPTSLLRVESDDSYDKLITATINERRKRFVAGYNESDIETPDINVTKKHYNNIQYASDNKRDCDLYADVPLDMLSRGNSSWHPNNSKVDISTFDIPVTPIELNLPHPPPPPPTLKRTFASERIPSETFADELLKKSKENLNRITIEREQKKVEFDKLVETRYNELMEFLTEKYYHKVVECLNFNAEKGKMEAFMNFEYDDFKANMPTMGKPREIQSKWLEEMKNPNSIFLKDKRALVGIHSDCWGNGAFTVQFKWYN